MLSLQPYVIECYVLPPLYSYKIQTAGALALPTLLILVAWRMDTTLKRAIEGGRDSARTERRWRRRSEVRRFAMFVYFWSYPSLAISGVHGNMCSQNLPPFQSLVLDHTKDLYLFNQEHTCNILFHQILSLISSLYTVLFVLLAPPVILFYTLTMHRWGKLHQELHLHGSLYESYKERYCFWDVLSLLRILVHVLSTEIYPFSPIHQMATHMAMTVIYTVLVVVLRPFRPTGYRRVCLWMNSHYVFEILSNLSILLLQVSGLLSVVMPTTDHSTLEYVTMGTLLFVVVVWVATFVAMPMEAPMPEVTDIQPPEKKRKPSKQFDFWRRNKVGEVVDNEELEERQRNLVF